MTNKNKDKAILVAVYGSLKSGESNNGLLINSELLGSGTTLPGYNLLDFKAYPGAILGTNIIKVEVWAVDSDTLSRLDRLESHPHFYKREEILINLFCGATITAWMYIITKPENYNSPLVPNDNGIVNWNYK
jgi:gamma-glutamylcyclotransferase (GGCT)/AIG2-like uncharacterized protein YtfP